jgi:arylsulfatase A-like enzyme
LLPQKKFWDLYPADLELPATFEQDPSHRPPHFQAMWQAFRQREWEFAAPGDTWVDGARRAWRGTLACVSQIDDVIGHLLRGLEERSLLENTVLAYHSDHGCYHGIHGIEEKAPGICSDAVCRVPLILAGPGVKTAGQACASSVENIDVGPTLAALAGLPPMDWTDGTDLSPILRGETEAVKEIAVTENPWSKALRWGNWRFVYYPPELFEGEVTGELYNLAKDPDETRNLYNDPGHRSIVETCRERLLRWIVQSRRVVTAHPPFHSERQPGALKTHQRYNLALDGHAPNNENTAARARTGRVNYL